MRTKDKILCLWSIGKCRFFRKRVPLAVRWQLTNRCTLRCRYCNVWKTHCDELDFDTVAKGIDALAKLGTKRISYSGGDVLLRDDFEKILKHTSLRKIYSEMNSNGVMVKEKIKLLKYLDFIKLSLDGPEDSHDFLRGNGSYRKVMQAADACVTEGIKFGFTTTLTKYNIDKLDEILKIAKYYNTIVAFQPLKKLYRGLENIDELIPDEGYFKKAIDGLISKKLSGNKNIRNSLLGLRHVYNCPKYKKLKCYAGWIFCIINPDGQMCACDRISYDRELPNITSLSVKEALARLPEVHCNGCGFCGSLELNYLMSFKTKVLASIEKIIT
ncbi:MAG: radical SAM protein [Candidatus Omnitrophota bacterium]